MDTSTPRYPQSNGQAELSNKIIIGNLKKCCEEAQGKWADKLSYILWADRTTRKNASGQMPFSLVYGCEVVLPAEVKLPSSRYGLITVDITPYELIHDLDVVEELRDVARMRMEVHR